MLKWRYLFLLAAIIMTPLRTTAAQHWYQADRSWSVVEENDAFSGGDSAYTQGVRLVITYNAWTPRLRHAVRLSPFAVLAPMSFDSLKYPCSAFTKYPGRKCAFFGFSFGQTMYTPPDLRVSDVDYTKRPYAGYLFISGTVTAIMNRTLLSSELFAGIIGPQAFARETQSLAHWTWSPDSPRPQGWSHQLGFSPQLTLVNQFSHRPSRLEHCIAKCDGTYSEKRIWDVSFRGESTLGTLMTRLSGGLTGRLGYAFPDVPIAQRIPSTRSRITKEKSEQSGRCKCKLIEKLAPWAVAFTTIDGRVIGHNALLSGGWNDRGDGSWNQFKAIETRHFVSEFAYGFAAGSDYLTLSWQKVRRSSEFTHPDGGVHKFGSLSLSVHSKGAGSY
jgi:hypothetical protein